MGFLNKLFGGKSAGKSSSAAGKISYLAVLQKQGPNIKIAHKRCDVCGRTFAFPGGYVSVFGLSIEGWAMDAGGYCRTCRVYVCPAHAKFKQVQGSTKEFENGSYRPSCAKCGTFLSYPQIDLIRIPAARRNKIGLKAAFEECGLPLTKRTCKECGALYPHPVNDYLLVPASPDSRLEDVDVDLGGYCQCCGYFVCSKHARLAADPGDGKEVFWQVECATCPGFPLIAEEKPLETAVPGAEHAGCIHKSFKEALASAMAQFSQPSTKRFSLRRLTLAQGVLMVEQKCGICGAAFSAPEHLVAPQMSRKVITENQISDDDFDVDLGGYCHSCQRYVCPKHAALVGADVGDQRIWGVACAGCSVLLTPNPNVKLPG